MKRLIVLGSVTIASVCLFAQPAMPQQSGKVLLIIRDARVADPAVLDWVITREAGVMKETLQQAGYRVEVASPTGEPWGTAQNALKVDRQLKDVNVADYKALVIPCMAIDSTDLNPDLAAVIKNALQKGKLVAAQNGGVAMLAKAGVLSGKKYAAMEITGLEFKDGIYSGSGVVKDGVIITSGVCPAMAQQFKGMQDGTPKLMEMLIAELKQAK